MSGFVRERFEIGETAVTIAAERSYVAAAKDAIVSARSEIRSMIAGDGIFLTTLEPYDCGPEASKTIATMCHAARIAGVGPMAAVAGTVAQRALDAMTGLGCTHGWVDNGGDIALILNEPVAIEVFSNPSSPDALAFELEPTRGVLGICSSSGRLGHSISFGDADIVTVLAESAPIADALATAIANRVKDFDSLRTCFDPFVGIPELSGAIAIIDGAVSIHGSIPRIVETTHNLDRVTAHSSMSSEKYLGVRHKHSGARA